MDLIKVTQHTSTFNGITQIIKDDEGNYMEVWFARDLQPLLGYARWANFQVAINRAVESCKSQNIYERGVDDKGFGRIRCKGDTVLFGGNDETAFRR